MQLVQAILLDDDPGFRRTLAQALGDEPRVRVLAAAASLGQVPREALVEANTALVDVRMPREPGPEAVQRIHALRPEIVCVMLTSHDDAASIFSSLQAGAVGYLLKTQSAAQIAAGLHEALAGGSPMSPGVARKVVQTFAKPASTPAAALAELTARERELLGHVARGLADKEVAETLGLSVWTVKNHLRHIYEKLHVRSRTEAVAKARGER
ncbi:MAG: response regulator transcription factor [Verrucomicrobia bacterium]|nr:response regulator transcription factor [Verrucomicrobiota bacterium]